MSSRGLWLDAKTYVSFEFLTTDYGYELLATLDGGVISELVWDNGKFGQLDGEICLIRTEEKYRRRGLATALFKRAQKLSNLGLCSVPIHSPSRTKDGEDWSKAVGGLLYTDSGDVIGVTNKPVDLAKARKHNSSSRPVRKTEQRPRKLVIR